MTMIRNKQGQFVGGRQGAIERSAIRNGQIRRHRRQRATLGPRPNRKKCSQCGEVKNVPDDFPMRKRKLSGGETVRYPAGECKKCAAARNTAWRAKQSPEDLKAMQDRWNANRNTEDRRRYNREYQRMQARLTGVPERGPWHRYRDEVDDSPDPRLPRAPLDSYLADLCLGGSEVARLAGMDEASFRRVKRLKRSQIDAILTRLGVPDQMTALYPNET